MSSSDFLSEGKTPYDPPLAGDSRPVKAGARHAAVIDRIIAWVGRNSRAILTTAMIFQVGILLGMIAMAALPTVGADARTVRLKVVPVDPRDLFRGDYVILSYNMSRITIPSSVGDTVYVSLVPEANGSSYTGGRESLTPGEFDLFLTGRIVRPGFAEFGIEKYFVPEGQGRIYEDAIRRHRLWAEVAVAKDGKSRLLTLVID